LESVDSRHIIVYYKDTYYRLNVYKKNGRILSPYDFQVLIEHIMSDHKERKREPSVAEANVAALTTLERSKWAQIREDFFSIGVNHYSLSQIEKCIFVVYLDEESPETDTELARSLFLGNGGNRWCDKSFCQVVYANGVSGMHVEHAWADAPIISHTCEITSNLEMNLRDNWDKDSLHILPTERGPVDGADLEIAQKLRFHMTHQLETHILEALEGARTAADDLDLYLYKSAYGKKYAKKFKLSPDSFIQMALQLGYYRCQKSFALTYESAMMRFFRDGRTETIRSLSIESCDFCKAMDDDSISREKKREMHQAAVEYHNNCAKQATCGDAVDRHLFALYVVAMGTETDSPFLNQALKIPWKLSTSQIPHRMHDGWPKDDNRGNNENFQGIGGGFGPVADDGYGVCYLVAGDNRVVFHISSKKACPDTSSTRLADSIEGALRDIVALYDI
jgi:carnitine O-palmitoyltransferase 1